MTDVVVQAEMKSSLDIFIQTIFPHVEQEK